MSIYELNTFKLNTFDLNTLLLSQNNDLINHAANCEIFCKIITNVKYFVNFLKLGEVIVSENILDRNFFSCYGLQ